MKNLKQLKKIDFTKEHLNYEKFQELALNRNLISNEKIGFSKEAREGYHHAIIKDINSKLSITSTKNKIILDIGCGCGDLVSELINISQQNNHTLILIDSPEMLSEIKDLGKNVHKISGRFPDNIAALNRYIGKIDFVLCYSVIQYAFVDLNIFKFIDEILFLLNNNGKALIGDVPNISMKKRFLSSNAGIAYHKQYMKTESLPEVNFLDIERGQIDDSVIFAILQRIRSAGAQSYVVPQSSDLYYANRREDILIHKF